MGLLDLSRRYDNELDPRKFSLPIAVIVEFESYTGAPSFHGENGFHCDHKNKTLIVPSKLIGDSSSFVSHTPSLVTYRKG